MALEGMGGPINKINKRRTSATEFCFQIHRWVHLMMQQHLDYRNGKFMFNYLYDPNTKRMSIISFCDYVVGGLNYNLIGM